MTITAERYHDISCGHRVFGHESKCAHLHGHNYRIHFKVQQTKGAKKLDDIGRVMDFSVIKEKLAMWLEDNYDHKFLVWEEDPLKNKLFDLDPEGVIITPYNPTAENIAAYIVEAIAPIQLRGTGCKLIECRIEETAKCSATYSL
jgi:6-pyruvoyltetrahydropterin/6-carboxytetrahydropterin synthase